MATTTKPWAEPTVGILTLGTGTASENSQRSQGSINVSGSPNFGNDTDAALVYALSRAKHVHLLGGKYPAFSASVALPDGAMVTAEPSAILQPAVSGEVGLFTLAGQAKLEGFRVLATTFVADMSLIKATNAKDVRIDDVVFQVDTEASPDATTPPALNGDASNPMTLIEFSGCTRNRVRGCTFLPNWGIRCILNTAGSGHDFDGNHFTSDVESGLGTLNPGGSQTSLSNPRLMYRGIDIQGGEWGIIRGNRFWNLGENNGFFPLWGVSGLALTLSSNNVSHTMARPPKPGTLFVSITHAGGSAVMRDNGAGALTFYSGTTSAITTATIDYETGALAINLADNITAATANTWHFVHSCILVNATAAISVDEQHHSQIALNRIEQVASAGPVRLWGVNSMTFALNLIGYLANGPAVLGEAGLVIEGKDGNDATNISRSVLCFGNDLHNNGKSGTEGAFVYARQCSELLFTANRCGVQSSTYALVLDGATCVAPRIIGNSFEGLNTVTNAIRITAGQLTKGIVVGGNATLNVTTLVSDASDAAAAGRRKVLRGIQNTSTGNDITTAENLALATTNVKLDV